MKKRLFRFDFISIYVILVMFLCSIGIKYSIDEIINQNANTKSIVYGIIRIIAAVAIIITHIYILNRKRLKE